jgi:hypothetical protein
VDGCYTAAKQVGLPCMGYSGHFVATRSSVSDMNSSLRIGFRIVVERAPVQISVLIGCRMKRGCVGRLPGLDRTVGRPDN